MTGKTRLEAYARTKLAALESRAQRRQLIPTERQANSRADRGGRRLISFCDNDYLALSHHPQLIAAARDATEAHGVGAGASRLVSGHHPLNEALERRLANLKGTEGARVFGSGYLANIGTIPALVGPGDLILMDELSHSCMFAGARLSGANVRTYPHNDVDKARDMLSECTRFAHRLLLTETVFSMDGDRAPLVELNAVAEAADAWLMTDDAHGFGVVQQANPAPIQMGTLSKAVGSYGGYVCGPEAFMELLISRARSLVYTTGLPPAVLAASLAGLDVISAHPERAEKALSNAALFCCLMDLPAPQSTIVPVILGDEDLALGVSQALQKAGFLVTAIRPPTVPAGTARLRVTFTTGHSEADVRALAEALQGALNVQDMRV